MAHNALPGCLPAGRGVFLPTRMSPLSPLSARRLQCFPSRSRPLRRISPPPKLPRTPPTWRHLGCRAADKTDPTTASNSPPSSAPRKDVAGAGLSWVSPDWLTNLAQTFRGPDTSGIPVADAKLEDVKDLLGGALFLPLFKWMMESGPVYRYTFELPPLPLWQVAVHEMEVRPFAVWQSTLRSHFVLPAAWHQAPATLSFSEFLQAGSRPL